MMMAMMRIHVHYSNQEKCLRGLQKCPADPTGQNKSTSVRLEQYAVKYRPVVPAAAHFKQERRAGWRVELLIDSSGNVYFHVAYRHTSLLWLL